MDRKDGFLFVGNEVVLDFLNTLPVIDGKQTELFPDISALLRWFQTADLLTPDEAGRLQKGLRKSHGESVLERMRHLREQLREEIHHWEQEGRVQSSVVGELNQLLAKYPMLERLKGKGAFVSIEPYFNVTQLEDLFGPLAWSAATLFANVDRNRVRQCRNCVLHFHDTSKKGTRRWCSMQLCGNRRKVAAYAARQRRRGLTIQSGEGEASSRPYRSR